MNIPHETFTLPNGLRVIVHEDRKAPVVAVSVWYNVGSKDEPAGRTGFAHLFEHIMFNGSENAPGEYFEHTRAMGATDLNGTTWFDRTNYFETVPRPALERALFLESDRMGHLLGALTQENLTNQIGVVQNEKRQGDNQPYGMVEYAQLEGLFPEGHPYRHSTIGSMADLSAATLDTARAWFRENYGPEQRRPRPRRRHQRARGAAAGRALFRPDRPRPGERAGRGAGADAAGAGRSGDARSGRQHPPLSQLGHARHRP